MNRNVIYALSFASFTGCGWDEGLLIQNLHGRVIINQDLLTRDVTNEDGTVSTIGPDVRLIGPVYLGLYSSIFPANVLQRYPYPEVGPQYLDGIDGNTYPYGGTTIGDLRYPCMSSLVCKLTSGRFEDYDSILDWFKLVGSPLVDDNQVTIQDGDYIQQTCYNLLDVTSDAELRITAYEDRNGDGFINAEDLDFVDDGDGNFVADFTIYQQEMFWDQNEKNCTPGHDGPAGKACKGFSLWGWMDSPAVKDYSFTTCDGSAGFLNPWYSSNFYGGAAHVDTLDFPHSYIAAGDVTASEGFVWSDMYEEPDVYLDYEVQ